MQLRKVAQGIYDRGKSRTNRIEAQALVDEALSRLRSWLKLDEKTRPTLGIITFNSQQQSLIRDLLDLARRDEPELEWFFAEERIEPAIVKNLENVQGDERDVILFSITYAQDATGKRNMDFGALNREGGERRLNVAVTRARQELVVFSGFTADLIDLSRTKALGAQHLKAFLDYAERGAIALPAQDSGSAGPLESPFEEAVALQLYKRGWNIVPQVGISGFRVDLGIRHPDRPGAYLAGVECDGATYHASATARDRDKVREQVLRGLGWSILRIWSTDWWFDAPGCAERLDTELARLLAEDRERRARQETQEAAAATHWEMGEEIEPRSDDRIEPAAPVTDETAEPPNRTTTPLPEEAELVALVAAPTPVPGIAAIRIAEGGNATVFVEPVPSASGVLVPAVAIAEAEPPSEARPSPPPVSAPALVAKAGQAGDNATSSPAQSAALAAPHPTGKYRLADLSGFPADPDRYYDFDYHHTLKAMIEAVIAQEAPMRADILAQRIARAHGWLRTGGRIRERIDLHLHDANTTEETSGVFIWPKGSVRKTLDYRPPFDSDSRRSIADIPLAELAGVVVAHAHLLDQPDPALDLARFIGVERLTAVSRARLEEAILRARPHLQSTRSPAS